MAYASNAVFRDRRFADKNEAAGAADASRAFTRLFLSQIAAIIVGMKSESVQLNDIEMFYETEGSGEPSCFSMVVLAATRIGRMPVATNSSANTPSSCPTFAVTEERPTLKKRLRTDSVRSTPSRS
jgi:hypothetical protein